jgi:hypothetical protein
MGGNSPNLVTLVLKMCRGVANSSEILFNYQNTQSSNQAK